MAAKKKTEPRTKKADIREVSKYALLLNQKIEADDAIKKLNAEIAKLFPHILDYFQRQGIDKISAGGRTLYLRREIHTAKNKDITQEQACDKLRDIGLTEYAGQRVNIQGLSAHVRDLEADGLDLRAIEEQFGGAFHCVELFKIGSRKR